MAWRLVKNEKFRRILFTITISLGLIAGYYSWDQARESAREHDENQQVIIFDMGILMENQKLIVENQKAFMRNGTLEDLRDINTDIAMNYSELNINPITGQPS